MHRAASRGDVSACAVKGRHWFSCPWGVCSPSSKLSLKLWPVLEAAYQPHGGAEPPTGTLSCVLGLKDIFASFVIGGKKDRDRLFFFLFSFSLFSLQ